MFLFIILIKPSKTFKMGLWVESRLELTLLDDEGGIFVQGVSMVLPVVVTLSFPLLLFPWFLSTIIEQREKGEGGGGGVSYDPIFMMYAIDQYISSLMLLFIAVSMTALILHCTSASADIFFVLLCHYCQIHLCCNYGFICLILCHMCPYFQVYSSLSVTYSFMTSIIELGCILKMGLKMKQIKIPTYS